jgi:hypothetical protein
MGVVNGTDMFNHCVFEFLWVVGFTIYM